MESVLNSAAPQLAELLPEISQGRRSAPLAPPLRAVPSSDPEGARFRLFDSLALLLKSVTDAYSSVEWLNFQARRPEPARLLVLATYRPVEVILGQHPLKHLKH